MAAADLSTEDIDTGKGKGMGNSRSAWSLLELNLQLGQLLLHQHTSKFAQYVDKTQRNRHYITRRML